MKLRRLLLAGLALASAARVLAHAHLVESSPAQGSIVHAAPRELVLRFSEPAALTTLALAKDGGAPEKITPLPQGSQARISVALPPLEPGDYHLTFRVLSADGHVVAGQLHFTLSR
jgi:methionine-rich copper-binding protein CopC